MPPKKHLLALISLFALLLICDQYLKVYIKTHFVLGEEVNLIGTWLKIHFIENDGMAYGLKLSEGVWAKVTLTLFRLIAIAYGMYYILRYVFPKRDFLINYLLILILAGAVGNLIDSMFYGVLFTSSPSVYTIGAIPSVFSPEYAYGSLLQGKVVDMIYCPIIRTTLPSWVPFYGGEPYEFFSPVFNFADSCISVGVFLLLFFHKRFMVALKR